jgi:hypothetical protein
VTTRQADKMLSASRPLNVRLSSLVSRLKQAKTILLKPGKRKEMFRYFHKILSADGEMVHERIEVARTRGLFAVDNLQSLCFNLLLAGGRTGGSDGVCHIIPIPGG